MQLAVSARGLAVGDYDNDGDLDLLVTAMDSPALLLRNDTPRQGHWLKLRPLNRHGSPSIGARVTLSAGGKSQTRELRSGSSHQSQNALELHWGLATSAKVDIIEVFWPGGRKTVLRDVAADRTITVREPQVMRSSNAPAMAISRIGPVIRGCSSSPRTHSRFFTPIPSGAWPRRGRLSHGERFVRFELPAHFSRASMKWIETATNGTPGAGGEMEAIWPSTKHVIRVITSFRRHESCSLCSSSIPGRPRPVASWSGVWPSRSRAAFFHFRSLSSSRRRADSVRSSGSREGRGIEWPAGIAK